MDKVDEQKSYQRAHRRANQALKIALFGKAIGWFEDDDRGEHDPIAMSDGQEPGNDIGGESGDADPQRMPEDIGPDGQVVFDEPAADPLMGHKGIELDTRIETRDELAVIGRIPMQCMKSVGKIFDTVEDIGQIEKGIRIIRGTMPAAIPFEVRAESPDPLR